MPLITITDSFGNEGNEIAQIVAEKLGVEVFDDRRLQNIVTKIGLPAHAKYSFEMHAPSFWDLLRSHEPQVYLDTMEAAVYEVARNGEGVIIGHGSQMLLRDFECAFHVRLLSDFKLRVENLISSHEIDRDEAKNLLEKYDKSQKSFFRYAFHIDIDTPRLYDLIVNLGKMKNGTIATLIIEAVQSDDIQSCSLNALSLIKKMSLERKIHAELFGNNIYVRTLKISVPETENAEITGVVLTQKDKDRVAEIVKNVTGTSHLKNNLFVLNYHF